MINIALIGYGKMGRLIDEMSSKYDIKIVSKIDPEKLGNQIDENS